MNSKRYNILLDNKIIGWTLLENADASMGVVFGRIIFNDVKFGYDFFNGYCQRNNIEIITDFPDDNLIATANLTSLKIINPAGTEITGIGANIEGTDQDSFVVNILGIPYPFFANEFPHHLK